MSSFVNYDFRTHPDLWTDIEIRALRCLYNNNVPISDISWFLCRPYYGVKSQISKHGFCKPRNFYTESDFRIIKKYAGKKTASYISSLIGHSVYSVRTTCSNNNISLYRYGDDAYNVKYPDSDVLLIRALYDEGLRICDISEKFEIDHRQVHILLFRRWLSSDYYLKHCTG